MTAVTLSARRSSELPMWLLSMPKLPDECGYWTTVWSSSASAETASMPTIARSNPRPDTESRNRVPIGIDAMTGMHASRVATTRPESSP